MSETAGRSAVAVVGLGSMGLGMARALLKAGFVVHGCDVNDAAVRALTEAGGQRAASPRAAAAESDAVFVVVFDKHQVESVVAGDDGVLAGLRPGGLLIQSSTVPPAYARKLGARVAAAGHRFLDAPISGGPARAEEGALSVLASGTPDAFAAAEAIFEATARNVYRLGDEPGQASVMKSVNQLLVGIHCVAAAEGMGWAIKNGLDAGTVYDVITDCAGSSWMFENRMPRVVAGDYTTRSAIDILVKDLGIVNESAYDARYPIPMAAAALQRFIAASGAGMGQEDDSAMIKMYARESGLKLPGEESSGGKN